MSITKNQNKPIVIGNPVEIEYAVNEIRKVLATMDWITHPYFIAQRFTRAKGTNQRKFSYPETYAPTNSDKTGYHRLTPDNDYKGMFFFMVGTGNVAFEPHGESFLTYPVSIIFSANLQLINESYLNQGLFTQELIRDARRLLTKTLILHDFDYTIKSETREIRDVYREFVLDDLEQYNRAPMQCFRLELDVTIDEECGDAPIVNSTTFDFLRERRINDLGWGVLRNDLNDIVNPFNVTEDQIETMPLRNDSGIYTQAPEAVQNLIDNDTNKIKVSNVADLFIMRLEFKVKTTLANRKGQVWFDIGTGGRFNEKRFTCSENANEIELVSIDFLFFQLDTFLANGGLLKMKMDGDAQIFDINVLPMKLYNGKSI